MGSIYVCDVMVLNFYFEFEREDVVGYVSFVGYFIIGSYVVKMFVLK